MMRMKKNILTAAFIAFSSLAFSLTASDAQKLLKNAEDNTAFFGTDFSGTYQIVQEKPGEGRNAYDALMYRRDSASKWTILITGPEKDKGKGYLQFDENIWFYDPADRRFTYTSSRDKFQNTNANNSDFAPQHYDRDYSIESFEEVKLGNFECVLFSLKAKVEKVDYPILKLWVSKNDGLVRKKEDYSASAQKLRTSAISSYQSVSSSGGSHKVPVYMIIQDHLRGKKINGKVQYERTMISISNVSFEKVADSVYTKPFLEIKSAK